MSFIKPIVELNVHHSNFVRQTIAENFVQATAEDFFADLKISQRNQAHNGGTLYTLVSVSVRVSDFTMTSLYKKYNLAILDKHYYRKGTIIYYVVD